MKTNKTRPSYTQFGVKPRGERRKDMSLPARVYSNGSVRVFTVVGEIRYKDIDDMKKHWAMVSTYSLAAIKKVLNAKIL